MKNFKLAYQTVKKLNRISRQISKKHSKKELELTEPSNNGNFYACGASCTGACTYTANN